MSSPQFHEDSHAKSIWERFFALKRDEVAPALTCAAYFFCLLLCYYMLRPVREAFGISRGYDKLPWLMTGTLIVTAAASPLFAWFASRFPRRVFVPWTNRFFAANIAVFWALLLWLPAARTAVGYAFYIWLSVFNMFVVSVFWAVVADVFGLNRGQRTFAFVAAGGTVGAIAGSWLVELLSHGIPVGTSVFQLDTAWLLLLSIVPLECSAQCVRRLRRWFDQTQSEPALTQTSEPTRDPLAGLKLIVSSRFLLTIVVFMLLFTIAGTLLYMEQGRIVESAFVDESSRRAAFASIDKWSNVVTLAAQLFLAGRLTQWIGLRGALLILPLIYVGGFAAMAMTPVYATMATFQIARRGLHYAIDRPVRELLFAGLSADARYKAKTFIDTFVYRAGDMVGGWTPVAFAWFQVAATIIAPTAAALSLAWLGVAALLGRLWDDERQTAK